MSNNFDIGPSFYFINTIIEHCNNKKLPVFLLKIKTRAYIKILRDRSLHIDVLYMC